MATEATPLKGLIGGHAAGKLAKHRQLHTVGDLLALWPRRYLQHGDDFGELHEGDYVVAVATVKTATARPMRARRGRLLNAVITDGTHDLDATFFDARGHERALLPGTRHLFGGTVTRYQNRLQLAHPGYTTLDDWQEQDQQRGLIAIYPAVPGIHSWKITECVRLVVHHLDEVNDLLPEHLREANSLPDRRTALGWIHNPESWGQVENARRRLRYEEALLLQLALLQRRAQAATVTTAARVSTSSGILATFDDCLPYTLTDGQRQVGQDIAHDLGQPTPMHRLLQGEVGSGKTVVALRAMLTVVDSGGQAALLAPTEVLAAQHAHSIRTLLGPLAEGGMLGGAENGTKVALLTGSLSAAARKAALLDIASGQAGIVIGTHALLSEQVMFADLALVVVDEQHRFGVEQRDALRGKVSADSGPPHVLTMTATPIPRTVAMTVFGDMETSTLTELPAGRAPITSHVVPTDNAAWMERTWKRVAEEVAVGRQVYVVAPRIGGAQEEDSVSPHGESTSATTTAAPPDRQAGAPLASATDTPPDEADSSAVPEREGATVASALDQLRANPLLTKARIEALHGRLPSEEKEAVMAAFTRGEIDILVATTVIEVGVDNPRASVMVILDADRFGVSQLHQLRGRVGRGGLPGLALLLTSSQAPATLERLQAVAATTDGFALARLDLEQRREGDVLGQAQHGSRSQLQHLSLLRDEELIVQARQDAHSLLEQDPLLAAWPQTGRAVADWIGDEQSAYLEKG